MKKIVLLFIVVVVMLISVSDAAAGGGPHTEPCVKITGRVKIEDIDSVSRTIKVLYERCYFFPDIYDVYLWLSVTESTKIRYFGEDWDATFVDLAEGQSISYAVIPNESTMPVEANTITIYP